ncbi:MAG: NAD(P)H-hydrate dehydratase [Candidatus Nanohaloarchaea archaeon]|nr:NAD(P)H-hydrate dehydratase [Candidatus Nanohaloarchaea archaeon]
MPGTRGELPERTENAVKGDHGHVLVVGGSNQYSNTPAIVSMGALRAGTDLVTVAAPRRSADITASFALNLVTAPIDGKYLKNGHVDTVIDLAADVDCLAVGPGLGRTRETQDAVVELLDRYDGAAVVDADAIHAAADDPAVLDGSVVTPHAGDFEALTGAAVSTTIGERRTAVEQAAADLGCTVLLKGAVDIVSGDGRTETVDAGNPYMTRGGTGDILTGITAALLAQGLAPFDAATTAAQVNGTAGDRALDDHGPGFLLEEMLEHVSTVIGSGGQG